GADAKAGAEQQAFAFGDVKLGEVVSHLVAQAAVVRSDFAPATAEVETKQRSSLEKVSRRSHDHVSAITASELPAADETETGGRDFEFPTELGIAVVRCWLFIQDDDLSAY